MLVLTGAILVGGLAGIALKEQQLADALVGVDAAIGSGRLFNGELAALAKT
jgi:hypothetical protein